ncbi:Ig-like domain-containing protein [Enterobacter cloacae complex sp. 342H5]|uniref:Ig-like domain-containing protein n=1 Tax=Enterobacter cloacae complex sp. 342H5 TaxID=3395846 RepID=UPI003CFB25AC
MKSSRSSAALRPHKHRFALEARQLFDGAAVAEAAHHADPGTADAHDAGRDVIHPVVVDKSATAPKAARGDVFVIDSQIAHWQSLASQLADRGKVVVIDSHSSGLEQLNQALAGEKNLSAIHIYSHGASDALTLGRDEIGVDNVDKLQSQLQALGDKLASDGDILLYGCSITRDDTALISELASLTHADIAASSNATGNRDAGGDWLLESATGVIDARTVALDYAGTLETPELANGGGDLIVSEPSVLNPGGETGQLRGWTLTQSDLIGPVNVNIYLNDAAKGTLSDGVQTSGAFLSFSGTAAEAQDWLNRLTFTATDRELGNHTDSTGLDVYVFNSSGGMDFLTQRIIITPANDPASVNDAALLVPENNGAGTVVDSGILSVIDPDLGAGAQSPAQMVYSLTVLPQFGYLTLNGQRVGIGSVFTQKDVNENRLRYVHTATGADQNRQDSFTASINDGATPVNLSDNVRVTLNIQPENQLPTVSGGGVVFEGQPQNATVYGNVGRYIDATTGGDPQDSSLMLTITRLPAHGTLYFDGRPVQAGLSFSYADRDRLTYANDGAEGVAQDSFGVRVTDQGGGTATPGTSESSIILTVNSINDNPIFDAGSSQSAAVGAGGRVVLTPAMINATDVDSTDQQVSFIVNTADLSHGYLTLNGLRLQSGDGFTVADVKAGRVSYVQYRNTSANERDSFDFQVLDHALNAYWTSTGAFYAREGGVYDGDSPEYNLTRYRFTIDLADSVSNPQPGNVPTLDQPPGTVASPVFGTDVNNPSSLPHGTLLEGGSLVLAGTGQITDATPGLSYALANADPVEVIYTWLGTESGESGLTLQKSVNGSWVAIESLGTFTQADINGGLIRFTHNGGENFVFNARFEVSAGRVTLDGSGEPQPVVWDPTVRVFVKPVNDAPIVQGSSANVLTEGATLVITRPMLSVSDPDDANSGSPYENSQTLNGQTNYALNNDASGAGAIQLVFKSLPTGGALQYYNGSAWITITPADIDRLRLDASILTSDGSSGLRFVSDGSEVRNTQFSVVAVDRWGASSPATATVGLVITNVNDGPAIANRPTAVDPAVQAGSPNQAGGAPANNPLTVTESGYGRITPAMLQAYDPDSSAEQVQYTLTSAPAFGRLARSTDGVNFDVLGTGSSFTQQDVINGFIYYLNDGVDRATSADGFSFRLSDGDKEQAGNQFSITITPANDAPVVEHTGGAVLVGAGRTPVNGFTIADADLLVGATGVTDRVQTTIRLLHADGTPFSKADYSDVTLAVSGVAGLGVSGGNGDLLVLTGTVAQVNSALAGLTVSMARDRNAVYQLQVITDDRLRDSSGALAGGANGGPLNQVVSPAFGSSPSAVDSRNYSWYSDAVPAVSGNLAASSATIYASSVNDPGTLAGPASGTVREDQATWIGGNFVITDVESNAFGLPVTVTLQVAQGTLGIGGSGIQTDMGGVTIVGDETGTLVLTGRASAIQALLNDPASGLTYQSAANANQDQNGAAAGDVTLNVSLDTQRATLGAASGSAPAAIAVALTIDPVNDAPTVTSGTGTVTLNNGNGTTFTPVPGFYVADPDVTDVGGIAAGETDRVRVTVRITAENGEPLLLGDYRGNSSISIGSAAQNTGVTLIAPGSPPANGDRSPVVIEGTQAQINAWLAQLQVLMVGPDLDDADQTFRVEVIVDDRLRDAGGALTGNANGGLNASTTGTDVENTPPAEIDPYAAIPAGLTQNVATASRLVFQSDTNDAAQIVLGDTPRLSTNEGSNRVTLPAITVTDVDAGDSSLTVTIAVPNGFIISGVGGSGGTVDGVGGGIVRLTGTLSQINSRLAALVVTLPDVAGTPDAADWNGKFAVTVTVNDNGSTGNRPAALPTNMTDAGSDPGEASFADPTSAAIVTTRQFEFEVTPVNDAPRATAPTVALPVIDEDSASAALQGTSVGSLFGPLFDDSRDAVGNGLNGTTADPFWGVAISQLTPDPRQGEWQYSTDGGQRWIAVGARSDANALFLNGAALLRFVPAANFFGSPNAPGVRLVENNANNDQSSTTAAPVNGASGSTQAHGGTSLYSDQLIRLSQPVANVNDSPLINSTSTWTFPEDGNAPATLGQLLDGSYSDRLDNQSAITGGGNASGPLALVGIFGDTTDPAKGHWEYLNNGAWSRLPADIDESNALILSSDTQMRFVQNPDYNGPVTGGLQLRVSDSSDPALVGGSGVYSRVNFFDYAASWTKGINHWSVPAELGVTIAAVSDIGNDSASVHAGRVLSLPASGLLANDSFENGGRLFSGFSQPAHGTLTFDGATFIYTPTAGYVGTDRFTYTVTSGGVTETATVTIAVTNIVPVAVNDARTINEDAGSVSGNLLTNDRDGDGDLLTLTRFTVNGTDYPAGATVDLPNNQGTLRVNADGSWNYLGVADWNGTVTLGYTISDGNMGGTARGTLVLTVVPVADVQEDVRIVHAGTSVTVDVLANDSFTNPDRTVTSLTQPANGRVTLLANNQVRYTPDPGYTGTDTYTYTVTSGGVTETATVTVILTDSPPNTGNFFTNTPEDTPATGNILATLSDPDNDALSVTGFTINNTTWSAGQRATLAGVGTFTLSARGDYIFTPVADWNGRVPTIYVTVSDGFEGGTNRASLDITVTPVADIQGDTAATHAGRTITLDVLANDSFENGNKAITGTSAPQHGSVVISGNKVIYTPTAGYVGSDSFTYTVTSGGVTETATVVVSMTNTAPDSDDIRITTAEDTVLRDNVLNRATDADGDALALTGFTLNGTRYAAGQTATVEAGTLTMNRDGSWIFTPAADWNGTVPLIRWTLSDGNTGTTESSLFIMVTPVADARNDSAVTHTDTGTIIPVLSNDTFTHSLTLEAGRAVNGSAFSLSDQGGRIQVLSDNTLRYQPPAGFVGTDTFTYTVTSYNGVTETATVTVVVTNSLPGTIDDRQSVAEDNILRGRFNATDADNDVLTVVSFTAGNQTVVMGAESSKTLTLAGVGTLQVNADLSWQFTPVPDWNGVVPVITYTVTDGNPGGQSSGTLTLVVSPVSDARDDRVTLHAGQADVRNLLANDTFSNSDRQVTSVTQGQHGSVTINADGSVTYRPDSRYVGNDVYTYRVTSGGVTETATVYVTITNTAPVVPAQITLSGPEDTTLSGSVLANASDADAGDRLHVTGWSLPGETRAHAVGVGYQIPGQGTFTLQSDGRFTFVPVADWNGSVPVISFTVSDGHDNGLATGQLSLTVTPVADIAPDSVAVHAGNPLIIDALKNDSFENSDRQIVSLGNPQHGLVAIQNGLVTYLPDTGYVGQDRFTYTVSSGGVLETATITVDVRNTAPQAIPDYMPGTEDSQVTGNVLANDRDLDGDALRITSFSINGMLYQAGSSVILAGVGSFNLQANGQYRFTSLPDWNGSVPEILYNVTDGNSNGAASNRLFIVVSPVQDAVNDSVTTHAGVSVLTDVLANDTFANGGRVLESFTQGAHGTVTLENGQLRYTPAAGYVGKDSYSYTVISNGIRETANVDVTLQNALPVSGNVTLTTAEDTPLSGNVLDRATDADNDPLRITEFTIGNTTWSAGQTATLEAGSLTLASDGRWTFTPRADWNGAVPTVTFTVTDGNDGGTTRSTLAIGVIPVGDTVNDFVVVHSDDPLTIPVLGNDTFTTPQADLLLSAGTPVAGSLFTRSEQGGQIRVLSDNTVQYLPPAGFTGTDSFTYTVTTPAGHQETATVTLAVLNGTPDAQQTTVITPEDTPAIRGQLNASDPDGDVLTLLSVTVNGQQTSLNGAGDRLVALPGVGTLRIFADRSFIFTPVADWNGVTPEITYRVTDGNNNGEVEGKLFIIVTPEIDVRNDSYSMQAGLTSTQSPLDNDSFSNPDRQVTGVTQGQHGKVTISADGLQVIYTPDPRFVGQDVYSYTVTSGGRTEVAYVTVEVTNSRPVLTPLDPVSGPEDTPLRGNVINNIKDANPTDTLRVVGWSLPGETQPHQPGVPWTIPGQGTFTLNSDGSYLFTPLGDWNGTVPTITFTVSDGHDGGEVTGELALTVAPVADIGPDYVEVHAGKPLIIDALSNDSFANADQQIVAVSKAAHGQVLIQNGKINYLPDAGYVGTDTFTYTVTSGGRSETATVTVNVLNAPPQAQADRQVVAEDTPARGNVLTNDRDSDGDALRLEHFTVDGLPGVWLPGDRVAIPGVGEVVFQANGDYLFQPVADWNGDVPQIIYTVSDGNLNGQATQTLNLSISPVGDARQDEARIHSNFPGVIDVLANDSFTNPDATLTGVTAPAIGTAAIVNGKVVYTPRPGYVGFDSFEYTVRSGGVEETATVVIWVTNQQPVASDITVRMNEDSGTVQGRLPVTDGDNDALRIAGFTVDGDATRYDIPANGSRTLILSGKGQLTLTSDGRFTFRPFADWNGTLPTITWTVTDGNENGSSAGKLVIVINPVADAVNDRGALLENRELITDALKNDTFEDPQREITSVTQGQHGRVTLLPDGRIRYVPQAGFVGTDSYTYTVMSGGVAETATIVVEVKPEQALTVYEEGLREGGARSAIATGTLALTSFDATQSVTINGRTFTLAQLQQLSAQRPGTIDFGYGRLEILGYQASDSRHGVLSYRYVQTQAVVHRDSQPVEIVFSVQVNDETGGQLRVNIIDDTPQARPDVGEIYQDRAQYSQSGNLFDNDTAGADGPAARGPIVGIVSENTGRVGQVNGVTAGEYGVLHLDANGNWRYDANRSDPRVASLEANASLTEVFTYTIEDADGNSRQATLTVIIHGITAMPQLSRPDGWREDLFGVRDPYQPLQRSFEPGLFILPMIYELQSSEHDLAIKANYKMAMLGYGVEQANSPVLEQGILFPRWFTSTRHHRDIASLEGNGMGDNLLWDAFSPFSLRHVESRETLTAPETPRHEQAPAVESHKEKEMPVAGALTLPAVGEIVHVKSLLPPDGRGAPSLSAQLAALHRPAPETEIVLPVASGTQGK